MLVLHDIPRSIAALKLRKGASEIFGAEKHRFRLRPHRSQEIAHLERQLAVKLPDSFGRFLIEVGSGAGPYYGIYSAEELLADFADIQTWLDDEQPRPNPAKDFAFHRGDAEEVLQRRREKPEHPWLNLSWPTDGCVPICFQGCTYWTALVTAGELAGTVWDVACYEGWNGHWAPARRASGILALKTKEKLPELSSPPTWIEWYNAWLERVEADLASLDAPQG
jgi:hypothetical protein